MPTYTDQLAALTAFTDSIINTNGVGAITGAVHNDNESAQNVSSFANLVAYDNYAYKVVRTYATDAENGQSLRDAYADAATFAGLSATNRFALLIPPGTYALGSTGLTLDTQFVDLIGLGRADETVITSVSNTNGGNGTIIQTTNDIKFRNLTIQNDAAAYSTGTDTDDSGYAPQGVFPTTEFTDCIFRNPGTGGDGAPFMRLGVEYGGTYQRCRGIDAGSGISVFFAIASGNYFDCHTSVNGFGYLGEASGIFTDSSCLDGFGFGADATGSFTRCTAFGRGFGSNGNASGTFNLCTALTESFGWGNGLTCSGTFVGCKATDYSFGDSTVDAQFIDCRSGLISFGNFFEMAGTYTNCIGGFGSFGSQSNVSLMTGNFTNCVVDGGSGFGSDSTVISGNFTDCVVNGQSGFTGTLLSGNFTNCHVYGDDGFTPFTPGGELSGTFKNCSAGERSFGYTGNTAANVIISGTFYDCNAGDNSFGSMGAVSANITISGTFNNCNAGSDSFGFTPFFEGGGVILSGTFNHCTAGNRSFGNGDLLQLSGTFNFCEAGDSSFGSIIPSVAVGVTSIGPSMSGTFNGCVAGIRSFGSSSSVLAYADMTGKFYHCTAGDNSYGHISRMLAGAEFYDCVGGDNSWRAEKQFGQASGLYVNCTGGNLAFNMQTAPTAKFINCNGGIRSFCDGMQPGEPLTLSGTYTNCIAGDDSFGKASSGPAETITLNGIWENCIAGNRSFGSSTGNLTEVLCSGTFINCSAGDDSFASNGPGSGAARADASGYFENCRAGFRSFGGTAFGKKSGRFVRCTLVDRDGTIGAESDLGPLVDGGIMQDCTWIMRDASSNALIVETGAKVFGGIYKAGASATESIVSVGAATVSIANILTNVALAGTITNNITSPNVIVDSDI